MGVGAPLAMGVYAPPLMGVVSPLLRGGIYPFLDDHLFYYRMIVVAASAGCSVGSL